MSSFIGTGNSDDDGRPDVRAVRALILQIREERKRERALFKERLGGHSTVFSEDSCQEFFSFWGKVLVHMYYESQRRTELDTFERMSQMYGDGPFSSDVHDDLHLLDHIRDTAGNLQRRIRVIDFGHVSQPSTPPSVRMRSAPLLRGGAAIIRADVETYYTFISGFGREHLSEELCPAEGEEEGEEEGGRGGGEEGGGGRGAAAAA